MMYTWSLHRHVLCVYLVCMGRYLVYMDLFGICGQKLQNFICKDFESKTEALIAYFKCVWPALCMWRALLRVNKLYKICRLKEGNIWSKIKQDKAQLAETYGSCRTRACVGSEIKNDCISCVLGACKEHAWSMQGACMWCSWAMCWVYMNSQTTQTLKGSIYGSTHWVWYHRQSAKIACLKSAPRVHWICMRCTLCRVA